MDEPRRGDAVGWTDSGARSTDRPGTPSRELAALGPMLVELNDLKRITAAGRPGSIATRLFGEAWGELMGGAPPAVVARRITARAVAAARLADIDAGVLAEAGLSRTAVNAILHAAIDAVGDRLPAGLRQELKSGVEPVATPAQQTPPPAFVAALAAQPRAGMTCPGKPRILLEPPENHADHCLVVAVYGVLLAPGFAAEPDTVFLAGLAHHLHNAGMPDAGFTGEMLLGEHLAAVMAHFTEAGLRQLGPALRPAVERARSVLPDANTPEGRAFHAADSIDRVLQIRQYGRAGALTPAQMLGEMELVHAGPVKSFQDAMLREAGLL